MILPAPTPVSDKEESLVVCFPRLRGTLPWARSPLGDRAYSGVSAMLDPHSSTTTRRPPPSSAHTTGLALLHGADFHPASFFTRPADALDGPAHRRRADSHPVALLPQPALLLQAQVIMRLQLRLQ